MPKTAEKLAAEELRRRERFTGFGGVRQAQANREGVSGGESGARVEAARGRRATAARNVKKQRVITGGLKALSSVAKLRDRALARVGLHRR